MPAWVTQQVLENAENYPQMLRQHVFSDTDFVVLGLPLLQR